MFKNQRSQPTGETADVGQHPDKYVHVDVHESTGVIFLGLLTLLLLIALLRAQADYRKLVERLLFHH